MWVCIYKTIIIKEDAINLRGSWDTDKLEEEQVRCDVNRVFMPEISNTFKLRKNKIKQTENI